MEEISVNTLFRVRELVEGYAAKAGYTVNPVSSIREAVLTGLARNVDFYGRPYCSCRLVTGELLKNTEEADKIVCPCSNHARQIAEHGCCHCGLLMTPSMAEQYVKAWKME